MNQKEIAILFEYLLNHQTQLEREVQQLRTNIRFRNIDVNDCVELMFALDRLAFFKEISGNVLAILNLKRASNINNKPRK